MRSLNLSLSTLLLLFVSTMSNGHDAKGLAYEAENLSNEQVPTLHMGPAERQRIRNYQLSGDESLQVEALAGEFGDAQGDGFEQAFLRTFRWEKGHILKVCFFDGSLKERDRALVVFDEILQYTNLGLAVSVQNCPVAGIDIQVKLNTEGCWSTYGNQSHSKIAEEPNLPTMALCNSTRGPAVEEKYGTIRHEFMHALAFVHENQHPDQGCASELNKQAVIAALFARPTRADQEKAYKDNIEDIRLSMPRNVKIDTSAYDPHSIMHYRLPPSFFKNGEKATCVLARKNNVLSDGDKKMLQRVYPK